MLNNSGSDIHRRHHQKSFRIKHDDRFFSRLVSKDKETTTTTVRNPSFRYYYGDVSGSVPFTWETTPGTPKHAFIDTSIPPLTPPPSYYNSDRPAMTLKQSGTSKLFNTLLLRINHKKKSRMAPSSPSISSSSLSSSSWSSSYLSISVPTTPSRFHSRRRFLGQSSFDDCRDQLYYINDDKNMTSSPTSTLCLGISRNRNGGFQRAGYSFVIIKRALLAMVCRGST